MQSIFIVIGQDGFNETDVRGAFLLLESALDCAKRESRIMRIEEWRGSTFIDSYNIQGEKITWN